MSNTPLMVLLFSASLLVAQDATLDCSNSGSSQTRTVRGPAGDFAQVKVSTRDDASKDSHHCMADYQLIVQPANGSAPLTADFLSSDGDWSRTISVQLDGFSADGNRVFGTLLEGGHTPVAMVFDYHSGQSVELLDIKKALKQMTAAKCGMSAAVAGTADSGAVVLESNPATQCGTRWVFDSASKTWHPFSRSQSVHTLSK
jgi:hypothetical protein